MAEKKRPDRFRDRQLVVRKYRPNRPHPKTAEHSGIAKRLPFIKEGKELKERVDGEEKTFCQGIPDTNA